MSKLPDVQHHEHPSNRVIRVVPLSELGIPKNLIIQAGDGLQIDPRRLPRETGLPILGAYALIQQVFGQISNGPVTIEIEDLNAPGSGSMKVTLNVSPKNIPTALPLTSGRESIDRALAESPEAGELAILRAMLEETTGLESALSADKDRKLTPSERRQLAGGLANLADSWNIGSDHLTVFIENMVLQICGVTGLEALTTRDLQAMASETLLLTLHIEYFQLPEYEAVQAIRTARELSDAGISTNGFVEMFASVGPNEVILLHIVRPDIYRVIRFATPYSLLKDPSYVACFLQMLEALRAHGLQLVEPNIVKDFGILPTMDGYLPHIFMQLLPTTSLRSLIIALDMNNLLDTDVPIAQWPDRVRGIVASVNKGSEACLRQIADLSTTLFGATADMLNPAMINRGGDEAVARAMEILIMLGVLRENTSQVITMTDWESNLTFIATMLKDALQPSSIVLDISASYGEPDRTDSIVSEPTAGGVNLTRNTTDTQKTILEIQEGPNSMLGSIREQIDAQLRELITGINALLPILKKRRIGSPEQ